MEVSDINSLIASFLPKTDVIALSESNKQLLEKDKAFSGFVYESFENIRSSLFKKVTFDKDFDSDFIKTIIHNANEIEEVVIINPECYFFRYYTLSFPRLQKLIIKNCWLDYSQLLIYPTLKELEIDGCVMNGMFDKKDFPVIQKVTIDGKYIL